MNRDKELTLSELAEQTGIPARTIRFYIARGLLPGPSGGGRAATYGAAHVARLHAIRKQQGRGRMLSEIARTLEGGPPEGVLAEPSAWWQYRLAEDVIVSVRGDVSPWRSRQIRTALAQLAAQLGIQEDNDGSA